MYLIVHSSSKHARCTDAVHSVHMKESLIQGESIHKCVRLFICILTKTCCRIPNFKKFFKSVCSICLSVVPFRCQLSFQFNIYFLFKVFRCQLSTVKGVIRKIFVPQNPPGFLKNWLTQFFFLISISSRYSNSHNNCSCLKHPVESDSTVNRTPLESYCAQSGLQACLTPRSHNLW